MLTSLLLAATASAAEPTWEAHAHAGWVGQGAPVWSGWGIGGAAGVALGPRAALELSGLVGVHGGGGLLLDLRPELRISPRPWTRESGGSRSPAAPGSPSGTARGSRLRSELHGTHRRRAASACAWGPAGSSRGMGCAPAS